MFLAICSSVIGICSSFCTGIYMYTYSYIRSWRQKESQVFFLSGNADMIYISIKMCQKCHAMSPLYHLSRSLSMHVEIANLGTSLHTLIPSKLPVCWLCFNLIRKSHDYFIVCTCVSPYAIHFHLLRQGAPCKFSDQSIACKWSR